jgi:hypothetical protein
LLRVDHLHACVNAADLQVQEQSINLVMFASQALLLTIAAGFW